MAQCVLFGGTGRLGRAFLGAHQQWLAPSRSEVDITHWREVDRYLDAVRPSCVIHAAAVVGKQEAERDTVQTYKVNVEGTYNIAHACLRYDIRLVYISSVSVFDGNHGPYREMDTPIPAYFYGWTKLAGEMAVRMVGNSVIIRTDFFTPGEFKYSTVLIDHYSSKMPVGELVEAIDTIAASKLRGIIHVGRPRDTLYRLLEPYIPDIQGIRIQDSAMPDFPRDLSLDISLYQRLFR